MHILLSSMAFIQISELDVSHNDSIGETGVGCIGAIVSKNKVDVLNMTDCGIGYEELVSFDDYLDGEKLKRMDLSSQRPGIFERLASVEMISNLLANVTECLRLTYNKFNVDKFNVALLQDALHRLHPAELKIQMIEEGVSGDGDKLPDLTSELSSEEYWKSLDVQNYEKSKIEGDESDVKIIERVSSDSSDTESQSESLQEHIRAHEHLKSTRSWNIHYGKACRQRELTSETEFSGGTWEMLELLPRVERYEEEHFPAVPFNTHCFAGQNSTKKIETCGDAIEAGGCSVTFPPKSFSEASSVTVTAKIGHRKDLPPIEGHAISPILHVDSGVKELHREATIKLSTWCFAGDSSNVPFVEVFHFSREKGQWHVIHECPLGNSGFIEFKRKSFFNFVAWIRSRLHPLNYKLKASVYASDRNFVLTLNLDSNLHNDKLQNCIRDMEGDFRCVAFKFFPSKNTSSIQSEIKCESNEGFFFYPSGSIVWNLDDFERSDAPLSQQCILKSRRGRYGELYTKELEFNFTINVPGRDSFNDTFIHSCIPGRWSGLRMNALSPPSIARANTPMSPSSSSTLPSNAALLSVGGEAVHIQNSTINFNAGAAPHSSSQATGDSSPSTSG